MKRVLMGFIMVATTVVVVAQAPQVPKPGPEVQALGAFVGNWAFSGEMKPGAMGPGGKMTGNDRITWLPGGFFVERKFEGSMAGMDIKGTEIYGYDSAKKTYTFTGFDSMGGSSSGTMTVKGSVWTASGTTNMGGVTSHERCTLTFGPGNTTLDVKCSSSADGGKTYSPTIEGKATKK
jgi:Protein of unknown function (DUF1579)